VKERDFTPQLSAIVITRNEAANIDTCLDSLAFCGSGGGAA
jgi:glycosyltransferase involved in cell wall biosynthesis